MAAGTVLASREPLESTPPTAMLDLLLAVVAAAPSAAAAVPAAPAAPIEGDAVTYLLGDLPRCARVAYVDSGADGRTWAWIVGGRAPQWAFHVPVQELARGCGADIGARQEARK